MNELGYVMNIKNIKCVITDFDKTLYSDGNMVGVNYFYAKFLFERNLLEDSEDAIKKLLKENPTIHMCQCIYKLARENGISDAETSRWFDNHVCDITDAKMKIVKPKILKELCEKFPVYVLSDSGQAHLNHYYDLFNYDKSWFAGSISNDFKSKNMSKTKYMKKIMKNHNLKPNEVLMVGDSMRSDIKAAVDAGIEYYHVLDVDDTEKIFKDLIKSSN